MVNDLSESFNVFNGFFESVLLSFEGSQDVRFSGILGSFEFFSRDGGQSLQFRSGSFEELVGMTGRTGDGKTEKTRIREVEVDGVGGVNETVFIEEVGGGSGVETFSGATSGERGGVAEEGADDLQSKDVLASPRSRSESQSQSDVVFVSLVSVFTSDVFSGLSLGGVSLRSGDEAELRFNEFNEFLMVFDTSSSDEDSVGVDVFKLELLEDVGM